MERKENETTGNAKNEKYTICNKEFHLIGLTSEDRVSGLKSS